MRSHPRRAASAPDDLAARGRAAAPGGGGARAAAAPPRGRLAGAVLACTPPGQESLQPFGALVRDDEGGGPPAGAAEGHAEPCLLLVFVSREREAQERHEVL